MASGAPGGPCSTIIFGSCGDGAIRILDCSARQGTDEQPILRGTPLKPPRGLLMPPTELTHRI